MQFTCFDLIHLNDSSSLLSKSVCWGESISNDRFELLFELLNEEIDVGDVEYDELTVLTYNPIPRSFPITSLSKLSGLTGFL